MNMKTNIVNPWYYYNNIVRNIDKYIKQYDIKYIYLDVDGVLIHSCQAICDIINEIQGTNFTGDEVLSWNFYEICPNLTDKDVEKMFADPIFFQHVKWINGALEFIERYKNRIIIVTKGTKENIDLKKEFFKEYNFDFITFIGLTLTESKGDLKMSNNLFIDDCTNNLNVSDAKHKIMFKEYKDSREREWQKDWNGLVMYNW